MAKGIRRHSIATSHTAPEGTVDWLGQWTSELTMQIGVRWDSGRSLMLIPGDPFEVLP